MNFVNPLSKQPTFKQCACRVEKLRQQHVVQFGESLQSMAASHKLTIEQLAAINRIMPPYIVNIGSTIEIPFSIMDVVIPPYMPYREVDIFLRFRQTNTPHD